MRWLFALALIAVAGTILGYVGLVGWVASAGRLHRIEAQNDSLRIQFGKLQGLERELARMSELNMKMQTMLGIEDPGTPDQPAVDSTAGEDTGGTN